MDAELTAAACSGDVGFLKTAVASKPTDYFKSKYTPVDDKDSNKGNMFHLAFWNDKVSFAREAMKLLPKQLIHQLLFQQYNDGWNPLHVAANRILNCLEPVKLILDFIKSFSEQDYAQQMPWLAIADTNKGRYTALQLVLDRNNKKEDDEKCALLLMSMDFELQCNMAVNDENSPLFLAVKNRYTKVAQNILMSSSYSVSGKNGSTPLHFAPNSSEEVLRLLLKKHPDLIDEGKVDENGFNVLHQWADMKEIWPFNILLEGAFPDLSAKIFTELIFSKTEKKNGYSPLHIAAKDGNPEIGRALINGYQKEIKTRDDNQDKPWKLRDRTGDTPLNIAMYTKDVELALYILSLDSTLCQTYNNRGESPLFIAVRCGKSCGEVIKAILNIQNLVYRDLRRNDGATILHFLHTCPEDIGKHVLGKFWWLMSLMDDEKVTALDCAKLANVPWLINLLRNPSLIQKEHFDWKIACQKDENWAVIAFVDSCQDLQKVCHERQDTPLHHIKFKTYRECLDFLKMAPIVELKNAIDFEGATPLFRALERNDELLAKALLTDDGVERNIEEMDLLSKLCAENDNWATMCKEIKVNPNLKTTYIKSRTNLDQMRNTLSVVAALLATITFAAGFTLPGGLNSANGNAMLAKKASFIVFLLADAYAMSTSMLVLFCLIWSMISNNDMSYLLVDRSVLVLMQSLYGTMVAFMTGIYTVIEKSTLWVAIVIFVMCSLIGISANRSVLHTILAKFIPIANQDHRDEYRFLKQLRAYTSGSDGSQSIEGPSSSQNKNQSDDQVSLLEEVQSFYNQIISVYHQKSTGSRPRLINKTRVFDFLCVSPITLFNLYFIHAI